MLTYAQFNEALLTACPPPAHPHTHTRSHTPPHSQFWVHPALKRVMALAAGITTRANCSLTCSAGTHIRGVGVAPEISAARSFATVCEWAVMPRVRHSLHREPVEAHTREGGDVSGQLAPEAVV